LEVGVSEPSRRTRRPTPPPPPPGTITIRPAVSGDAGSLFIPPGTITIIQELAKGIRVKRFVVPGEER